MVIPKQVISSQVEDVRISTVKLREDYYDTCIFLPDGVELEGIDPQRSYRTMTWQGAREEHQTQRDRVREALMRL